MGARSNLEGKKRFDNVVLFPRLKLELRLGPWMVQGFHISHSLNAESFHIYFLWSTWCVTHLGNVSTSPTQVAPTT